MGADGSGDGHGQHGDHLQSDHHHADRSPGNFTVLTISDTRTPAEDSAGDAIVRLLGEVGWTLADRDLCADEVELIVPSVTRLAAAAAVLITTGGTGISPRDITPEAIRPLLDTELPGFGEAFRATSRLAIGPHAILSRALAGRLGRTLVFVLPGSQPAVELALRELIIPILGHAIGLVQPVDPLASLAKTEGGEAR